MKPVPAQVKARVLVVLALAGGAAGFALLTVGAGPAPAQISPPTTAAAGGLSDIDAGRQLFQVACTTCHGTDGEGVQDRGPSLVGVGAASADFYLTTGRMPLDRPRTQAERKRVAYSPVQIRQLVAFVSSLGAGPAIPRVNASAGDLPDGNRLYANNCAPCHSSAGAGGALGHAVYAPPLNRATPTQVAEAIRVGPGPMPVFGPDTLDDGQVASIVRYVAYLHK